MIHETKKNKVRTRHNTRAHTQHTHCDKGEQRIKKPERTTMMKMTAQITTNWDRIKQKRGKGRGNICICMLRKKSCNIKQNKKTANVNRIDDDNVPSLAKKKGGYSHLAHIHYCHHHPTTLPTNNKTRASICHPHAQIPPPSHVLFPFRYSLGPFFIPFASNEVGKNELLS